MAKQTAVDPMTLLLTERNLELEREISSLRRELKEKETELEILYSVVSRPAISSITNEQVNYLADLIVERVKMLEKMNTLIN